MEYDFDNWDGINVPLMEYTYSGEPYPKDVSLYHPDILHILSKKTLLISKEELAYILSLPEVDVRNDLHNLIYWQLGTSSNSNIIGNCMMCLLQAGTQQDTLPVVLEVLRQNEEFRKFHFDGLEREYIQPFLYKYCKDNPELLLPFLLEPGLNTWFKTLVLEVLAIIANLYYPSREKMHSLFEKLISAYKSDLYSSKRQICDGEVVGFALLIPIALWAEEYLPLIEELNNSGLMDYGITGKMYFIRRDIKKHKVFYTKPFENSCDFLALKR